MQSPKIPDISETERIAMVYKNYRGDRALLERWDPENPGNQAILVERQESTSALLRKHGFLPLTNCRILDVGCGSGRELASLACWAASPGNLYGVDLLADRIETARQSFPEIHFQQSNAELLNFPDSIFDLVLLLTVFTSILDGRMARNIASEVKRVIKPGGAVLWYDFRYNNPRNRNVRGMTRSAIHDLFPDFELRLRTVTLLPPLARRLGRATSLLYPLLSRVPFLRTHYIGLLIKP